MTTADRQPNIDPNLNRVDRRLWQRFITIAQPYWFPIQQQGGRTFLGLLFLLLVFLFAFLFVAVSAVALTSQYFFPSMTQQIAGGLVKGIQGLLSSPIALSILIGALVLPLLGFVASRNSLQSRWRQWALLALLLLLSLSVSGLNVVISYVARFFQTALAEKNQPEYWRFLFVYASVFVVGTPIVVIYRYMQSLLGLYWRDWLTGDFLSRYFGQRSYYEINANKKIDNPDQRISEDVRSFTGTSLSFLLIILGSLIDLVSFTGILISISPILSFVLVSYAIFGTVVTVFFGRKLIGLNFEQLRKEANFRYGLVHVRDNAESIAFYRGENQESGQVRQRFSEVVRNFNALIGWQRNLGFFTTGFNYFVVILPAMFVAPLYFAGQLDFGAITQASIAFSQVLGALSIVVDQIERLSAFAAGVNRLATFSDALDAPTGLQHVTDNREMRSLPLIDVSTDSRIAIEHLTLQTPNYQRTLVQDLSVAVNSGEGLVIVGQSGAGKSSLLRALAGLWRSGTGLIVRPEADQMLFLPQRPYMRIGTLREQLLYPNTDSKTSEEELRSVLQQVNLADLPERVGGFNAELDWADLLSLGEQQRLAFARLLLTRPRFALLDESTSALDLKNEEKMYQQLREMDTTYVSVGHRPSLLQHHRYVLELQSDNRWNVTTVEDYRPNLEAFS